MAGPWTWCNSCNLFDTTPVNHARVLRMCSAARLSYDDKNQLMKAAKPSHAGSSTHSESGKAITGSS
jgi:hypothetical protein